MIAAVALALLLAGVVVALVWAVGDDLRRW